MPLEPTDFRLTTDQAVRVRTVLHLWDARDPWQPDPRLERELFDVLSAVTTPRLVVLASAVHTAKFLRGMLDRAP